MKREHPLGSVIWACRAGAHATTGVNERGMSGLSFGLILLTFVADNAVLVLCYDLGIKLGGGLPGLLLAWVILPLAVGLLLPRLAPYQFRERGVRRWRWFRGREEHPIDAETTITWRRGDRDGNLIDTHSLKLILGRDTEDGRPFLFRVFRRKDEPKLLEVALHYSRPRAERMRADLAQGEGVFWIRGLRLDPEGLRYRSAPKEPRSLLPYDQIERINVDSQTLTIKGGDGTVVEGETFRPNYLAGRIVLDELRKAAGA